VTRLLASLMLLAMAVAGAPASARAQVFGQLTPADPVPLNGHLFGGYLHASDHFLGLMAQLRLSFYPDVDFGFQGGLTRIELGSSDVTSVRLGGDLRFMVARASEGRPADVALGGALGVETGDDISILSVGPTAVGSRSFLLGSRGAFVPYAGIALLFSNVEVLKVESADFSVPLRIGTELRPAPEFRIIAELEFRIADDFNDDVSFITGINLPF
jgi:hypothetical protein